MPRTDGSSASGPAPKTAASQKSASDADGVAASTQVDTSDTKLDAGVSESQGMPSPDAAAATTPRAFVLAAAGFIGALAALVLMFLAQTLGLVNAPNGQLDEQRSALLALERQVDQRFAALDADQAASGESGLDQVDLAPLETEMADLRSELTQLSASLADDADPSDFSALLVDAVAPLEERIAAIEAVIRSPALAESVQETGEALPVNDAPELLELRDLVASVSGEIAVLRSDLGVLRSEVEALATSENSSADQIAALDERLNQMGSDMAGRLEALSVRVGELGDGLAVMGDSLSAFEQAPVALAPDQLARLGLALDGLAAARDAGDDFSDALAAARAASTFDADLSDDLAPLADLAVTTGLDDAGLLARFDGTAEAMLAAAPGAVQDGGGLLDSLGERARQMVTIRSPEGSSNTTPGTVTGQIDQLGSLVASRQYEAALALFGDLPDAVQSAGDDLQTALAARVTLDATLIHARSGLLAALASNL
jgi:hypothetical protein